MRKSAEIHKTGDLRISDASSLSGPSFCGDTVPVVSFGSEHNGEDGELGWTVRPIYRYLTGRCSPGSPVQQLSLIAARARSVAGLPCNIPRLSGHRMHADR